MGLVGMNGQVWATHLIEKDLGRDFSDQDSVI